MSTRVVYIELYEYSIWLNSWMWTWLKGGETWLLNPNNGSLALMMANSGYEVWVGNTRSSNFTFGHVTYTRKDKVRGYSTLQYNLKFNTFLIHSGSFKPSWRAVAELSSYWSWFYRSFGIGRGTILWRQTCLQCYSMFTTAPNRKYTTLAILRCVFSV